jgi:hypothetical protein
LRATGANANLTVVRRARVGPRPPSRSRCPGISVSTIGFTRRSAECFFGRLVAAGARKVIDVRLLNTSQLAGFAKADDLAFFLRGLGDIRYLHEPLLAPTEAMVRALKRARARGTSSRQAFSP